MPADHVLLAAIGHAEQGAVAAHRPYNRVRLLLISDFPYPAGGDVLGKLRQVAGAEAVVLEGKCLLHQLPPGPLDEQNAVAGLDRGHVGAAINRRALRLRRILRIQSLVQVGCAQRPLAPDRADHQRLLVVQEPTYCVHIVGVERERQRMIRDDGPVRIGGREVLVVPRAGQIDALRIFADAAQRQPVLEEGADRRIARRIRP